MKHATRRAALAIILVATFIAAIPATAQTWSKSYWYDDASASRGVPNATEILEASDGSTIAVGGVFAQGMLLKLDPYGNLVWSRKLTASPSGGIWGLVNTLDGGFAVAGSLNYAGAPSNSYTVVKFDIDGSVRWQKRYGEETSGMNELARALAQSPDGSLVIAGYGNQTGSQRSDIWLVKTDADGNVLWQRRYGGDGDDFMAGPALGVMPNGNIVLACYTYSSWVSPGSSPWILILDSDGNILSQRAFVDGSFANDLVITQDGGFVVVASGESRGWTDPPAAWLLKFDATGVLLWEKRYNQLNPNGAFTPTRVRELPNGDLVVFGDKYPTAPLAMRVTSTGDFLWAKWYDDHPAVSSPRSWSLGVASDGSILLGSFAPNPNGTWLLRTDGSGGVNSECPISTDYPLTVSENLSEVIFTDATPVVTNHPSSDVTVTIDDIVLEISDLCPPDAPHIDTIPWALDFGTIDEDAIAFRTIDIRNTGTQDLWVSGMFTVDPYSVPRGCANSTILPDEACTAEVEFHPASAGDFLSELTVESNDPERPVIGVPLHGVALFVDPCASDPLGDSDGDGVCDSVDSCPSDPDNDADGDGICGDVDVCPLDPDNDIDGDGICGDVDSCPLDALNDIDGDAICGDVDTCIDVWNPDQRDSDLDGTGDACEPTPAPGSRAYATSADDGTISVIDTASNTVTHTLSVGSGPNAITVSPNGRYAMFSRLGSSVFILDTATHAITGAINVGPSPAEIVFSSGGLKAYVAVENSNSVAVVNTSTNAVTHIPVGVNPWGLAISRDGSRLLVSNVVDDTVTVIATTDNSIIATISVGDWPRGIAFTHDGRKAYVANMSSHEISIIDLTSNEVDSTLAGFSGPTGITVSPDGSEAWVANLSAGTVSVINTSTDEVTWTINVGLNPNRIAFTPDGAYAYVVNQNSDDVSVIDVINHTPLPTIQIGRNSIGIAVLPGPLEGSAVRVYWADQYFNRIQRSNVDGSNVENLVTGLQNPRSVAVDSVNGKIYWNEEIPESISRTNLDGSNLEVIVADAGPVRPIDLDPSNGKIYWGDAGDPGGVYRANLDGTQIEEIVSVPSVWGLALDLEGGTIFFATWEVPRKIYRISMDGTGLQLIYTLPPGATPGQLSVDSTRGKLYWTEFQSGKIQRADFNGGAVEDVLIGLPKSGVVGLDVDPVSQMIYWAYRGVSAWESATDRIQRATADGSRIENLVLGGMGNTLGVALEFSQPAEVDSDGDGVMDDQDHCPFDPDDDIDDDGICGDVDACPLDADNDIDGDGICGDVDTCPLDPFDDVDGDGFCGDVDACPLDPDNDLDGDGICGDVDVCPLDPQDDLDGDSVCGDVDNCPTVSNENQEPSDIDGIGEACAAPAPVLGNGPFMYVLLPGSTNAVSAIDIATNNPIGDPISVGADPVEIAISPDGHRAYVTNRNSHSVSVIDTAANTSIGDPIAVGSGPYGIAVTPDGGRVYVVNRGGHSVSVIDATTNTVTGSPIEVIPYPVGIAISPDGRHAYVTNDKNNSVSVIDTATNMVVGPPITVGAGPFAVAFTPDGTRAYVTNASGKSVSVIDTATHSVVGGPIEVGSLPLRIAITPDGKRAYVVNGVGNSVSVIDTSTNSTSGAEIMVGSFPIGISLTPDGSRAYVTNRDSRSMSVIDTASNSVVGGPIRLVSWPTDNAGTPGSPPGSAKRIFWTEFGLSDGSKIVRARPDGSELVDLVQGYSGNAVRMAIDSPRGKVYWTVDGSESIWLAYTDGSALSEIPVGVPAVSLAVDSVNEILFFANLPRAGGVPAEVRILDLQSRVTSTLATFPGGVLYDLALDTSAGQLYILHTDGLGDDIYRIKVDGTDLEKVQSAAYGEVINAIAIDPDGGMLYWSAVAADSKIKRMRTDRPGVEIFVTGPKSVTSLAVDSSAGKVYWVDTGLGTGSNKIWRANLDGTGIEDAVAGLGNPICLALEFPAPEAGDTQTGFDSRVRPYDSVTGAAPITVIFEEVIAPGETSLTTNATGPPPPDGFVLGHPPVYYELDTTALYDRSVQVCITYDDAAFSSAIESSLVLLHYENNAWTDTTISLNTDSNTICGVSSTLALHAVFATNQPPIADSLAVTLDEDTPGAVTLTATDTDGDRRLVGGKDRMQRKRA